MAFFCENPLDFFSFLAKKPLPMFEKWHFIFSEKITQKTSPPTLEPATYGNDKSDRATSSVHPSCAPWITTQNVFKRRRSWSQKGLQSVRPIWTCQFLLEICKRYVNYNLNNKNKFQIFLVYTYYINPNKNNFHLKKTRIIFKTYIYI